MTETTEIRRKRLKIRSIRRGIREMDLLLTAYAEEALPGLTEDELDAYEALISENDHDLLAWITGVTETPDRHKIAIDRVIRATSTAQVIEKFSRF